MLIISRIPETWQITVTDLLSNETNSTNIHDLNHTQNSPMILSRILIGLAKLASSNDKNMLRIKRFFDYVVSELLFLFCSFCELFLLIFILLYVFFESFWFFPFIFAGILGRFYQDNFFWLFFLENFFLSKFSLNLFISP